MSQGVYMPPQSGAWVKKTIMPSATQLRQEAQSSHTLYSTNSQR